MDLVLKRWLEGKPVRIIVLKPRQAGFSTLIGSFFSWLMFTHDHINGIAMADKSARTNAIADIYTTFLDNLPAEITPMISSNNSERLELNNPKKEDRKNNPGLSSGLVYETANDPNAGRSTSRQFAHLSEFAFYKYASQIDEGVQNSIPLAGGTCIIKESTANGRAGDGKQFYDLWQSAKKGESLYEPYFVAWYEVDDYTMPVPLDFELTKQEEKLLRGYPLITKGNLVWRRNKISEYFNDKDSLLGPEERFKQDFPSNDEEAFLHTGSPVFDQEKLKVENMRLTKNKTNNLINVIKKTDYMLNSYKDNMLIITPPRSNQRYYVGADVSEGLAEGDFSSAFVMDENYNQVAAWHGKIDPDLFGHLLIDIGRFYNNALLIPEANNMGHTTVVTIRNEHYPNIYKIQYEDKITKEKSVRYGWLTTAKSKQDMLNEFISVFRDGIISIKDLSLIEEMAQVTRKENGNVDLNGKDRVVAACLAVIGRRQNKPPRKDPMAKKSREIYDTWKPQKKGNDIFS